MPDGLALFQPFPMLPRRRAQVWRHQPSFRRPRHFHDEPEVNLVVRGSATFAVGRLRLTLQSRDALLFQPGQDHELLEASADLELFVGAVTPELAARDARLASPRSAAARLSEEDMARAVAGLRAASHLADTGAVERELMTCFEFTASSTLPGSALERRSLGLLRNERGLSASELAHRLHSAPSELSRRFHRAFGVPLVEYRSRLRLMEFIRLVDAGLPLTRAALEADFGSYAQCFRVFQRSVGCSPSEYFEGARRQVDAATWRPPGEAVS